MPGVGEKTAAKLINQYGGLDGIFANVDAQTPKLKASLVEHEARARKNLELMILRHDAPLDDIAVADLGVDPNPEELQRLFDFLEFRTLGIRLGEALAGMGMGLDIGGDEDRQELVAEVADDRHCERSGCAAHRRCPPWRSVPRGSASPAGANSPAWRSCVTPSRQRSPGSRRRCSRTTGWRSHSQVTKPSTATTSNRSCGRCSPPGIDLNGLALDTAIAAYLIDPAEARYTLPDLIEKYTRFARPSDVASSGQLDLDGTSMTDAERAGRDALAVHALAAPLMASLEAQGMAELYRTIENPLVVVLAKMEHVGIAVDVAELEALGARLSAEVDTLGCRAPRGRRSRRSQPELTETAARDPLRRARPEPGQEDQDRVLDRRRHVGEDQGPVAGVPRTADALSRGREAPQHLRRGSARRGRPRRSHPRDVQPDRRTNRAPVVRPAEPPQHPGAHRRGTSVPAGVHPSRGHARCWSPTTTRSSCAASPIWPPIPG